MYKAKFRTAYLQREVPIDVAVIGSTALKVGQLVTLTAAANNNPQYIAAASGADATAALKNATHIIAQSDMTMEYGHIPVEDRDYKYSDEVAVTAASISSTAPVKKVALFELINEKDVVSYSV